MNLTWHIAKKDLRAFKWPLGIWLLCIVSKLGVGVMLLSATGEEGAEWFQKMDMLAKCLGVGELLGFVLVAALIQEDLMVGTCAFWMTRPISGGRLLRAKLLGIGLVFLLAPVLVTLPWWLGCGYGIDEIAWAAAETVVVHAIVVLAALLWSAVTDGLGRFLMWTLVTLAVMPMVTAILSYYARRGNPTGIPELLSTRLAVAVGIMMLGVAVVLVHQYLTRHTWRSIGVIGATIGLSILVLGFWPWAWNVESKTNGYLIRRAQGDWSAASEPAGLKFAVRSAEFSGRKDRSNRPGTLSTSYLVEGVSAGQGFISYPSEHSWHWADETSEKGYAMGRSLLNTMALHQATAFVEGKDAATPWDREHISMLSVVPSTTMEKIRAQPPAYRLQARLRLMQFAATTPLPLQAGAWQTDGVVGERIAAVEKDGEQVHVTFIRHAPSLFVDLVAGGQMAPAGGFSRYFLINRTNGHVDGGATAYNQETRIASVSIRWQTLTFRGTSKGGGPRPTLEAINALNEAELVKVSYREQARFIHEFEIDAAGIARANP